ncbi:MAG: RHS repeat protein [Nitrospirae bacterium]|nr:RHS repeat protein [Nitrospirota bacterium]
MAKALRNIICLVSLFLAILFISPLFAETVNYFYDDLGRLTKAVSETGEVVIYEYDEVGNLFATSKSGIKKLPPELHSITPDIVFVGNTLTFTLVGENLFTTEEITSTNQGLIINRFSSVDTEIKVDVAILSTAQAVRTDIIVKTSYGVASIPLNIARLILSPSQVALTPQDTAKITALIEGYPKSLTVSLNNHATDIISAPQSVTIPYGSSTVFTITALKEGTGVITAENTGITIYVTQPFSGDVTIYARPVTIWVEYSDTGTVVSSPVNVEVKYSDTGTVVSSPVNVEIKK